MAFHLTTTTRIALFAVMAGAALCQRPPVRSLITVCDADGGKRKVLWTGERLVEAPNWAPGGGYLLVNSGGKLWKLPLSGGDLQAVDTGDINKVNNDHGISPDGKWFAISAGHIYVLPSTGGTPRQVTQLTPSYYHGWSPDGKTLAYCARREDNFDIYSIPVDGGVERRLSTAPGYDDGPDYSPDGRWIYFNSDRSGSWDIWRMPAGGAGPNDRLAERITSDDFEDWFPHPSPDGRWLLILSYGKGVKGHPANQNVCLRRMPMPGAAPAAKPRFETVVELFGGQGTINVNSWAPDSKRFAYVSYELLP